MPKFRVESNEMITISRETWIEAASVEEAQTIAEGQDWRTWSELHRDGQAEIVMVEEA